MQRRMSFLLVSFLLISLFSISLVFGATSKIRNQVFIGARPLGLGETFVAIADDGNSIYWNPAGLPTMNRFEISSMHTELFNMGIQNNYLSFIVPYSDKLTFGVDWFHLGFSDNELQYGQNKFNLSLGTQLYPGLSIGLNIKRLINNASLDDQSAFGWASGWGSDVGMLFSVGYYLSELKGLKLGLMIHDFTNTNLKYDNGRKETIFYRNFRYGMCYEFRNFFIFENPLFAMDFDDRFHCGTEFWLPTLKNFQLGFRAGVQKDIYTHGENELTNSFGTSLKYQFKNYILNFDYSYTNSPNLMDTNRFSLGAYFTLPTSPVKLDTVAIEDIYASLYPYHANRICGTLQCNYNEPKKTTVQIRLEEPNFDISYETKVILDPEMNPADTSKTIPIIPFFSHKILNAKGSETVRVECILQPKKFIRTQPEKLYSNDFTIYGIGQINWANGENQAAAFITPEDPVIREYSEKSIRNNQISSFIINETITHARQIFNHLNEQGIQYIGDAKSNYNKTVVDNILYPRQLLAYKMGDCDDMAVLLSSLYQSIGINTALVSVPGHIFLMFDSGIHKAKYYKLCLPQELLWIKDNHIWIPLEVTWLDKTFMEAWEEGAKELNNYKQSSEYKIIDVDVAWQIYQPIPVNSLDRIIERPVVLASLKNEDVSEPQKTVNQMQQKHLQDMETLATKFPDNPEYKIQLATTHAMLGNTTEAKQYLYQILKIDSTNYMANNNLANIYFLEGILDSAYVNYTCALQYAKTTRDSNGVYLNMGLLYSAIDSVDLACEMFNSTVRNIREETDRIEALRQNIEELLGVESSAIQTEKASEQEASKKVSPKKVLELAQKSDQKRSGKKTLKRIRPKGKKISRSSLRKARRPSSEIEDTFYWAN